MKYLALKNFYIYSSRGSCAPDDSSLGPYEALEGMEEDYYTVEVQIITHGQAIAHRLTQLGYYSTK